MVTLSNLVQAMKEDILRDAKGGATGETTRRSTLEQSRYFWRLALDRCASFNNSICRWNGSQTVFVFTRQAISDVVGDFSEANIMGEKAGLLANGGGHLR